MDHPYAFKNGDYCCKTNEEDPRGGSQSEQISGTCDGVGWDITSTCCSDNEIKCPAVTCIDYQDKMTTTTTTKKQR